MARIKMQTPDTPYDVAIDSGVTDVTITKAYLGVRFISDGAERLSVSMRDNGFELIYAATSPDGVEVVRRIELKGGTVS